MSGPAAAADRNLLFGILAVQMNFISRDALVNAMNAWVLDKQKPLGQILLDQKTLAADTHQLLNALVQKHLEMHGGDPEKSLAAVSSLGSIHDDLRQIADPAVQASLACVTRTFSGAPDPFATCGASLAGPGMRFRVLRPHARGGLGEVFVARDEEVHREVALKEIQARHADNAESRARFLQEAELTGGLEHPGIVPVYGLGQYADGRPYYAMRFIKGDSLKDAIERFHRDDGPARTAAAKGLELRELLGRFVDVCNAIAYAHSRGILHRDLKPGNIMLGKYGETLVVDWGLAKPLGQKEVSQEADEQPILLSKTSGSVETMAGSAIGTPQFMSPEQAAGRLDQLGPASDVYSLGATLYCLLTGQPPFGKTDIGVVLQKVKIGEFPTPRQIKRTVPAPLEAICLKAMALKPQDRYSSPQALADDIEHWLADEAVAAYREPLRQRLARWARRHQTIMTAGSALLLAGLVAVSVGYGLLAHEHEKTTRAQLDRARAQINALLVASPSAVPTIIEDLEPYREWVTPQLRELRDQPDLDEKRRTRASLALLADDPTQVAYLEQRMLEAEADEMLLIRDYLVNHRGQLTQDLWTIADDPKVDVNRRFRAIVALAAFDPDNRRWGSAGSQVVDRFLSANPLHLSLWTNALRPVRGALLDPLAKVCCDKNQGDRRQVAASILADYAADRPEMLIDLLLDADPRQFAVLILPLRSHGQKAVTLLRQEIEKGTQALWNERVPDPNWMMPTSGLIAKIKAAQGVLTDHFAFCQTMPLEEFASVADGLRSSGYRPIRARPYRAGDVIRVAAVWTRDGREWRLADGVSAAEIRRCDATYRESGLVPVDVAGFRTARDSERFVALWANGNHKDSVAMLVGLPDAEHGIAWQDLKSKGLVPFTYHKMLTEKAVFTNSQVWAKLSEPLVMWQFRSGSLAQYENSLENYSAQGMCQVDVSLCCHEQPPTSQNRNFAAVWQGRQDYVSKEVHGSDPGRHLVQCRELAAQGWRIAALTVAAVDEADSLQSASVWQRQLASQAEEVALARRRAQAAVALVQLNQPESIWPLFRHQPNPTARSYLIHLLGALEAGPQKIVERVEHEADVSARRALLLSLGQFDRSALPVGMKERVAKQLLIQYHDDPDPGLHSAIDWLLRQRWGMAADLKRIDDALAGQPIAKRHWYVNKQGQTFAVLQGPAEFLMGSPASEPDRYTNEVLHRQRVARSLAIATRKTTVEQFQRFLKAHPEVKHSYPKRHSPEADGPIISVTWFEAAQYCRWLSEQEGTPEEQMCYPPIDQIKDGMKLPEGYLRRTGYRLPTEAEWEFASRAGATTGRFYGAGEELLEHYAWYQKNSTDRAWVPGQLKPNDFGLFDALGNVWDWTQNRILPYPIGPLDKLAEDNEDLTPVVNTDSRIFRGGKFSSTPQNVRCAFRNGTQPLYRSYDVGFRVVRTCGHDQTKKE